MVKCLNNGKCVVIYIFVCLFLVNVHLISSLITVEDCVKLCNFFPLTDDKKEKVKDTKKKKKKSKVALFIRAALSWFFFSPSYEPFRFPSSDDYEVNERRMVEKEEVKERMQEEEVVEKEMVMTEEEVVEKEEVEKNMKEKETITDIVRKEEVEERVVNRRRMTTRTIYSLKEEMNRKFPIQKQHMWPNNRPASKAQAARRGENRHILLWGQRKV
ncbi:uncharacterized protein isoform X6 [Danio rerio]|uniref:Uncharacterized protein isoform X6 n=1 Tax=Danio rerio TaxID=7955 RepID=A0AC58HRB3_DANRE